MSYEKMAKIINDIYDNDYHISTLRKEFSNLKREDYLEFKTRYRQPIPVLTPKGKLAIKTHLAFKRYDRWDQKWRLVIFDLPGKERKSRLVLKEKLKELGFGQLQKSAYISPHRLLNPIERFASHLGIRQYLRLMEIDKIDNEKKIAETGWDLELMNQDYRDFMQTFKQTPRDKFWPLWAKKLEQEFARIYKNDPHLPAELLPKNWLGQIAYQTFKKISNSY